MLQGEHSAIISTFIKLPKILSLRSLFCLCLSGRFTLVLLYLSKLRPALFVNIEPSIWPSCNLIVHLTYYTLSKTVKHTIFTFNNLLVPGIYQLDQNLSVTIFNML